MRSTASALDGIASAGDERARQVVEREVGVARADRRLERGGVAEPRRSRCARRRPACRRRSAPASPRARAAGRSATTSSRRRGSGRSTRAPAARAPRGAACRSRPGTRSASPGAPGTAGSERLSVNRDLPAVGAHAAQVRILAGGERLRDPAMSLKSAAPGERGRRIEQPLEGGAARPAVVSRLPSAKRRPASNWMRNVRLPREMIGRSRARPGTMTVPGRPSASA